MAKLLHRRDGACPIPNSYNRDIGKTYNTGVAQASSSGGWMNTFKPFKSCKTFGTSGTVRSGANHERKRTSLRGHATRIDHLALDDFKNIATSSAACLIVAHHNTMIRMRGGMNGLAGIETLGRRRDHAQGFTGCKLDGVIDRVAEVNRAAHGA